jgi:DNA-binding transcriptional MerR regulator
MSKDYFTAKDINSLLGINKDKLYHWTESKGLVKPEIEKGYGRGAQSKYSLKNLMQLSLVKELYELKFDLNRIKEIIKTQNGLYDRQSKKMKTVDIWDYFKANRAKYEMDGYILIIVKDQILVFAANEKEVYKDLFESSKAKKKNWIINKPFIVIDLLQQIESLEKKTGNKL